MSAYHRLISYIYAYEGRIKGKNTGFAKLETRGTSCRIQVSVRPCLCGWQPIGVYLLAGQEEIRIGTLFVRGGNGSSVPSSIVKILKEAAAIWKSAVV